MTFRTVWAQLNAFCNGMHITASLTGLDVAATVLVLALIGLLLGGLK